MPIKFFLADDHAIIRDGLKMLLREFPHAKVIGEASTGLDTIEKIKESCADIIILDIAMPKLNGIAIIGTIKKYCPQIKIIILTMYCTSEHLYRAFTAGADAYVLKECAGNELYSAIRHVLCGKFFLSESLYEKDKAVINKILSGKSKHSPIEKLSSRELEILQNVVEGKTSAVIAAQMLISVKTVETYRHRLMKKLDVDNLPELVKFAVQHGLTTL